MCQEEFTGRRNNETCSRCDQRDEAESLGFLNQVSPK